MAERHTKAEGLDPKFLEAQSAGLLPDRLEMHRRGHHGHGRRNVNKTLVLVIQDDGNLFQNGIYDLPDYGWPE